MGELKKTDAAAAGLNLQNSSHTFCLYCSEMHIREVQGAFRRFILKDGEQIYSPQIEYYKKISGQIKVLYQPMFHGYLFFETNDPLNLYTRVQMHMGKTLFTWCKVLRNGDYICPITIGEENLIRSLCDDDHVLRKSTGFKTGDKLMITDGPLRNKTGLIVKIDRHKKIAILKIPFMGDDRYIKVGLEVVKKI